jgi:hypothetical protein
MKHSQWKDSHDKKQAKGGMRHGQMVGLAERAPPAHKSEWFFDVFLVEYIKFVGLSKINTTIKQRISTLFVLNVGPLHFTVERWRAKKVKRYG